MKNNGKVGTEWLRVRTEFLKENPPNHQGYYKCTYCPRWITADEITVDHVVSRTRAPHRRFDKSNIVFACGNCNEAKGSGDVKIQQNSPYVPDEIDDLWGSY